MTHQKVAGQEGGLNFGHRRIRDGRRQAARNGQREESGIEDLAIRQTK